MKDEKIINNSVMKCCICNNEKTGVFITINDKKYHLCCIEQLQNNWNELKKWLEKREFNSDYESYLIENYTTYTNILSKINELEILAKGENI